MKFTVNGEDIKANFSRNGFFCSSCKKVEGGPEDWAVLTGDTLDVHCHTCGKTWRYLGCSVTRSMDAMDPPYHMGENITTTPFGLWSARK